MGTVSFQDMNRDRLVTMKYLAQFDGVDIDTVRRYVKLLRSIAGDCDLFSAQEGSVGE